MSRLTKEQSEKLTALVKSDNGLAKYTFSELVEVSRTNGRAMYLEGWNDAIEAAAKKCHDIMADCCEDTERGKGASECQNAIRALRKEEK